MESTYVGSGFRRMSPAQAPIRLKADATYAGGR